MGGDTIAENGALGVGVIVRVWVGGIREKKVGEASGVKVGRRVSVMVGSIVGLAVQVASGWSGVIVNVGRAFGSTFFNGFRSDIGLRKINKKYAPIQIVISRTRIESISHNSRREVLEGWGAEFGSG